MNTLVLLLTLTLNAPITQQPAAPPDRWLGEDKLRHAFASMTLVGFAHAGARVVGIDGTPAVLIGVSSSTLAGVGKELFDRGAGRPFSVRDLAWNALGIGLGALIVAKVRP
ncbi:MAG: hypothetical protein ACRENP_25610 [Longimicrobiales bacterium]